MLMEGMIMREQLQARLAELKREFETGQARLRELETQEARLRETMLRISGAIQVLEETLAERQTETATKDEAETSAPAE
jgi:predicted nuclease with TOPRIM domain